MGEGAIAGRQGGNVTRPLANYTQLESRQAYMEGWERAGDHVDSQLLPGLLRRLADLNITAFLSELAHSCVFCVFCVFCVVD